MSRKPTGKAAARPAAKPAAVTVPVRPKTLWRLLIGGFATLGLLAAIVWAIVAGTPQALVLDGAKYASDAGFSVRQVEISGASNQPRLSIYRELLQGGSDSMLLTDVQAMRQRLVGLPWVLDASVQRRWPDSLKVTIVERRPIALWQHQGRLQLIDQEGRILPSDRLEDFRHLPLLVGRTANGEARAFLKLVADTPRLMDAMDAAIWVGDRRWDIRMKSGETLSLPEGPEAAAALRRFAEIDSETPLLGQGFVRFDLRIPDKMVVRVSAEGVAAGRKAAAAAKKLAEQQAGVAI